MTYDDLYDQNAAVVLGAFRLDPTMLETPTKYGTSLIQNAELFARAAHRLQKYGDESKPYADHLKAVVKVLWRFGIHEPEFVAAAWLHDTVEDTGATVEEIQLLCGPKVAELVSAVTNESGRNRKERHEKTYPKIRATPGAILLKLADRIANVEASRESSPKHLKMYRTEHPAFVAELRQDLDSTETRMWDCLEALMEES